MNRHRNEKESGQMINGVAFEVRANVAIRIIVEGVELEPHPLLTMDANGTRRKAWQSIASAAINEMMPAPRSALAPPKTNVINAADAIEAQLERRRARQRKAYRKKRQQEVATPETAQRVIQFKPATCVHCGKEFIRGGPRQVLCKRKPCQVWKRKQLAQVKHERKTSAQENA